MNRDDRASPRTATIVILSLAVASWAALLTLVRLTFAVF